MEHLVAPNVLLKIRRVKTFISFHQTGIQRPPRSPWGPNNKKIHIYPWTKSDSSKAELKTITHITLWDIETHGGTPCPCTYLGISRRQLQQSLYSGFSLKEKQNYQSKETKTKETTNNNMQKATEKKKTLACSLTDLVKYLTWTFLLYYRPLLQIVKSGKSFFFAVNKLSVTGQTNNN